MYTHAAATMQEYFAPAGAPLDAGAGGGVAGSSGAGGPAVGSGIGESGAGAAAAAGGGAEGAGAAATGPSAGAMPPGAASASSSGLSSTGGGGDGMPCAPNLGISMAELALAAEPPTARGIAVFRDPVFPPRAATAISWHPEGSRIAVAYAMLGFQGGHSQREAQGARSSLQKLSSTSGRGAAEGTDAEGPHRVPANAFLWDVAVPNVPLVELLPPSPLVSIRFNAKTPDILIGGCYNGLVATFDIRKPRAVVTTVSSIERSHRDPVYDVFWVQSKTNNQFVSVSTGEPAHAWGRGGRAHI